MPTIDDIKARLTQLQALGAFPDVLQVVPTLDDVELLTHPAAAELGAQPLTYHGGPTIVGGSMVLIYVDQYPDSEADMNAFAQAICQNGYYLSPDGKDSSPSKFLGAFHIASNLTGTVDDSRLQTLLNGHIGNDLPHNDGQTLYVLIMPPTLQVSMGGELSCQAFCGYHSGFNSGGSVVYYAVIDDPSCVGCHGNFTPQQGRSMILSHEYGEWRSDPMGNAWYNDSTGMENGDECAWNLVPWGPSNQWAVQPLAVNGKGCYVGAYQGGPPPPPAETVTVTPSTNPTTVQVGQPASFAANVGGVPTGHTVNVSWTFGDGLSGSGLTVTHAYASPGNYSVGAMATDVTTGVQSKPGATVVAVAGAPPPPPAGRKVKSMTVTFATGQYTLSDPTTHAVIDFDDGSVVQVP